MELEELIEIMSGVRDGEVAQASNTLSWEAYHIARGINDLDMLPDLQAYLSKCTRPENRAYVYDLMSFIGKNTQAPEVATCMLTYLDLEDEQDENLHRLLSGLYDTGISLNDALERMCHYAFDERELIRGTAILLLARYNKTKEKIIKTLKEVVQYHYDEWDLKYAIQSFRVHEPETYRKTVLAIRNQLEDELSIERIDNILKEL